MIATDALDSVIRLLDELSSANEHLFTIHPFGETEVDGIPHIGWVEYNEPVIQFIEAVYGLTSVIPEGFNWPDWQSEAAKYVDNPARLDSADIETCAKLLLVHVRKDRFCEGHLATMLENGHIAAVVRRLKELKEKQALRNRSQ